MKATPETVEGVFLIQWLEFPTGNRAYGGGGWSRGAKYRPAPEPVQQVVTMYQKLGKSVLIGNMRKLKINIFDATSNEWVRCDYPGMMKEYESFVGVMNTIKLAISKKQQSPVLPVGGRVINIK